MNENLEKRKTDFTRYLNEELERKPQGWWRQRTAEYIATKDVDNGKKDYLHHSEETIIKFNFKRALISGALFFIINFVAFFCAALKEGVFTFYFWMINSVVFILVFHPLVKRSNKGVVILFNKEGFWVNTMPGMVSWNYLVASYIKEDDSGESTNYYLTMFYYDESKDEFVKEEYYVEGLDMDYKEIAFHIEYWKIKAGNSTVII